METYFKKVASICASFYAAFMLTYGANSAVAQSMDIGMTIDCIFSQPKTIEFEKERFNSTVDKSSDMRVTFSNFKPDGSALIIGNAGAAAVFYDTQDDILVMAQLFGSPIRSMTSIPIPQLKDGAPAVMSRHMWLSINKTGVFSKWSGACKLR